MQKPNDFDQAQAAGNIEVLPVGAYKCKIMKAEPMTSSNGKEYIKISYDINDGDYKDFYKRKYQNDSRDIKDKKWSGVWTVFVLDYNGNTNRYFKGLITCAESSNKGFKFDFAVPGRIRACMKLPGHFSAIFGNRRNRKGIRGNGHAQAEKIKSLIKT